MIAVVLEKCAGLDVHRDSVTACLMWGPAQGEAKWETQRFGTTVAELMKLKEWLEKEEATAKLQRAQLSSCQLPTYYAGWKGWLGAREKYKQRKGAAYSLKEFNERALKESAAPLAVLEGLHMYNGRHTCGWKSIQSK